MNHLFNLLMKHSLAGEYVPHGSQKFEKYIDGGVGNGKYYCDALLESLEAVNEVCKKVSGADGPRLMLELALKASKKLDLKPRKHFEVRWNSFLEVVNRLDLNTKYSIVFHSVIDYVY